MLIGNICLLALNWGDKMGSVKDITILEQPKKKMMGRGEFNFSDRYSVFDWGEMPDLIPRKGAALCTMSAWFFEELQKLGIKSSYNGLIAKPPNARVSVHEISLPTNIMEVALVRKPTLAKTRMKALPKDTPKELERRLGVAKAGDGYILYEYLPYQNRPDNILVPLEIIYRNTLPKGSSVFKRLKAGTLTYQELGLDRMPEEGERLPQPYFDVSTKLEDGDRYLSWNEAQRLAGLNDDELERIKVMLQQGNKLITEKMASIGISNDDGKFEFGIMPYGNGGRDFMFVDVLGTPDECRFTMDGIQMSKEVARQWYRREQPDWVEEVGEKKGGKDWKEQMIHQPKPLPPDFLMIISNIYTSMANAIMRKRIFDAPPLDKVRKSLESYVK